MIKTIKTSHQFEKGSRFENREPVIEIGSDRYEVVCRPGYWPHKRAGIPGQWRVVFTRTKTGERVFRNG